VNNSAEPIEDLVRDLPWPARVIAPGRNLGYARGVNEGIRAAKEDRVLILNPDLLVRPGSIEALERCADEHPRAGILAPKLLNPDGTLQLSARRFYNWKTLLLRRAPLGPYANRSRAHAAGLLRFAEKWSAVVYAVSRFRGRILSLAALVTDVLAAVLAFLAAYGIRTALNGLFEKPVFPLPSYGGLLFFTIAVTVAAMAANGPYRRTTFRATAGPQRPPEAAAARLPAPLEDERIQLVCVAPEPSEVPFLLAAAASLRDSGAAIYWAGSVAQLAAEERLRSLGNVRAVLLHAPSRGLSVRARKRASDLLLSIFVAPFRWGALRAYLTSRGAQYGPGAAWG